MHPNLYLQTYWRSHIRPEIFVAMSFSPEYDSRFKDIIEPAIGEVGATGAKLIARRVDLSKSGDSIVTQIMDGVAHSEMVLADVSTAGYDAKSGRPYRNANVMYEVGLALACRQPAEVLLLRDDLNPFLFDVSTIPHLHVDFSNAPQARVSITEELNHRLAERNHLEDARIASAISTMTAQEKQILHVFAQYTPSQVFWITSENLATLAAVPRLLDKQLMTTVGITHDGHAMYRWTRLGYVLAQSLTRLIPTYTFASEQAPPSSSTGEAPPSTAAE